MVKGFRQALLLMLLVPLLHQARAEDIRASAHVDSTKFLIGDWVTVHLDVEHLPGVRLLRPALPDSIPGFELVKADTGAIRQNGQAVLETYTFTLAAFDSGAQVIPPIAVRYRTAGDTSVRSAATDPIAVFVKGIAVDTSKEFRDIKSPLSVPIGFWDIFPYLVALIVLAGIIWLVSYIRKRRARGEPIIPEAPPRPAHELALEALRALGSENLWQRGRVKEYHTTLTDIVRTYIERKFGVIAMEMTSDEILASPDIRALEKPLTGKLQTMLVRADLVKFAKYQPLANENEESLTFAVGFVEETSRPVVTAEASPPAAEVTA